jgi:uncharacterized protein YndB with AHSA1/START domain
MAEYSTSIDIDAAPVEVFQFLTTVDGLNAWMGAHADLEPLPGGRFEVDIAGYPIRGRYLEVDPPTRVVVSWGVAGSDDLPAGSTTVAFVLTPIAGGTRLDLTHSDLPEADVAGHADGWTHFVPRLAVAASGGLCGPDNWHPLPERSDRLAGFTGTTP